MTNILLAGQSPKVLLYYSGIHLQPTGPQYPVDFSMKQEISKTILPILVVCQSLSSVSCLADSFMKQKPKRMVSTLRQVQQSFLCGFCMSSSYSIESSTPGKSSFLPKCLTNSIRNLSNAHLPLEVIGAARNRYVSLS